MGNLTISQQKIGKAIDAFENGLSMRSLYSHPSDPLNMGKGTAYKLKRLWNGGELSTFIPVGEPDDSADTLAKLWDLRKYGRVKLLNRHLQDQSQVVLLKQHFVAWKELIDTELRYLSPRAARDWDVMGTMGGRPLAHAVSREHAECLGTIAERVERLREVLYRYEHVRGIN